MLKRLAVNVAHGITGLLGRALPAFDPLELRGQISQHAALRRPAGLEMIRDRNQQMFRRVAVRQVAQPLADAPRGVTHQPGQRPFQFIRPGLLVVVFHLPANALIRLGRIVGIN
jgi:hypothetical protein